ncbi:Gfo/Idh/MocA family oxidoreductase [Glutamicibacter endophyticus]
MRIGIVGYGTGGSLFHLPYIQADPRWQIVGVVTRSAERRALLACEAPGITAYGSLEQLLAAGVDVVVLTTPAHTRRELVLQALAAGVHVVADKPFAPDLATARELRDAARQSGKVLTVYHNRRWDTDLLTLREVIHSGELGQVNRAHMVLDQDDPASLEPGPAGGLLRDLGSHVVDQMISLFGPVAEVDARLDNYETTAGVVDGAFSLGLHHCGGVYSTVSSSKISHSEQRSLCAYGTQGYYSSQMSDVQIDRVRAGERPAQAGTDWGMESPERWGEVRTAQGARRVPCVPGNYAQFYSELYDAFSGAGALPVTVDQALHTVAVLDAARHGAQLGVRQRVESEDANHSLG